MTWQQWLFAAGYTLVVLGVGGLVENRLGWRRMQREFAKLQADSYRRSEELAQLRNDVRGMAADLYANEDRDDEPGSCDACGIDEIVAADPQLRELDGYGWLLYDGERE